MKIRILGPVTPARLAEALETSVFAFTQKLGDEFGGIFGANLYVQGFKISGERIDFDSAEDPGEITLHLPNGVPARPDLDPEVRRKRAEAKKAAEAERHEQRKSEDEAYRQRRKRREEEKAALQNGHKTHTAQFKSLVASHGQAFIDACNAEIRAGWEQANPLWLGGPNKGAARPTPALEIVGDEVVLRLSAVEGRRIDTPLSKRPQHHTMALEPHIKHAAWSEEVLPRLRTLIENYGSTK